MENLSEMFFTTGEFARILGVSKHTLFHYDDIGLFCPLVKTSNGYRYYFVWQIDTFETIQALQRMGMTLEEIKVYMRNRSPECFLNLIEEKKGWIDQEIRRLMELKVFISEHQKLTELGIQAELEAPAVVYYPEEPLYISPVRDSTARELASDLASYMRMRETYPITMSQIGTICYTEDLEKGDYERCRYVYSRANWETPELVRTVRPAGRYVEVYYADYHYSLEKPYRLIQAYAKREGILLGQTWYEDIVVDEMAVRGAENYITRVIVAAEP